MQRLIESTKNQFDAHSNGMVVAISNNLRPKYDFIESLNPIDERAVLHNYGSLTLWVSDNNADYRKAYRNELKFCKLDNRKIK